MRLGRLASLSEGTELRASGLGSKTLTQLLLGVSPPLPPGLGAAELGAAPLCHPDFPEAGGLVL